VDARGPHTKRPLPPREANEAQVKWCCVDRQGTRAGQHKHTQGKGGRGLAGIISRLDAWAVQGIKPAKALYQSGKAGTKSAPVRPTQAEHANNTLDFGGGMHCSSKEQGRAQKQQTPIDTIPTKVV
jgi:hypothetical protein